MQLLKTNCLIRSSFSICFEMEKGDVEDRGMRRLPAFQLQNCHLILCLSAFPSPSKASFACNRQRRKPELYNTL